MNDKLEFSIWAVIPKSKSITWSNSPTKHHKGYIKKGNVKIELTAEDLLQMQRTIGFSFTDGSYLPNNLS